MDIAAIAGLVTAVGALVLGLYTQHSSARRAEVDSLRETLTALQAENERLRTRVRDLEAENTAMRCELDAVRDKLAARTRKPRPEP